MMRHYIEAFLMNGKSSLGRSEEKEYISSRRKDYYRRIPHSN